MSEIIGLVGISHSPFATMLPPPDASAPGGRFLADAARVAAAVARLAPDAVVVIGPDHFHANFYDVMPPFVLGVEEAEGFGDFGSRSGPLPVATELAWPIRDGLAAAGFDVALSYALTVDHGVVQSYDVLCGVGGGDPAGAARRQHRRAAAAEPGTVRGARGALGAAVRGASFGGRVLLIASGGLSHWLPSNDPRDPSVAAERRASVIHGRRDVRAFAAAREPAVRAMGGNPNAHVNTRVGRLVPQAAGRRGPDAGRRTGRRGPGGECGPGRARDPDLAGGAGGRGRPAGVDQLRGGARVDHGHGHRHDV